MLTGCGLLDKKKKEAEKKEAEGPTIENQSGDHAFQSFIGRLRSAVRTKDFQVLAQLMTSDFGYRWDDPPAGETVFSYWNDNKMWPMLNSTVSQDFVPHGVYMVAPPAFAADPGNYDGYRAGVRLVNGSWRFAYFIGKPPMAEQALGQ